MEEIYKMLNDKFNEMKEKGKTEIAISFQELARLYQMVCLMKQIKGIINWEEYV